MKKGLFEYFDSHPPICFEPVFIQYYFRNKLIFDTIFIGNRRFYNIEHNNFRIVTGSAEMKPGA